jgi:hypothetical protein
MTNGSIVSSSFFVMIGRRSHHPLEGRLSCAPALFSTRSGGRGSPILRYFPALVSPHVGIDAAQHAASDRDDAVDAAAQRATAREKSLAPV